MSCSPFQVPPPRLPSPGTLRHYEYADVLQGRECKLCAKPLGYDNEFWYTTPTGFEVVHRKCRNASLGYEDIKQTRRAAVGGSR